jgi:hypothetical protein
LPRRRDERLRDSLSFQTLYLGLSPFDALAVYALLGYVEIAGGIRQARQGSAQRSTLGAFPFHVIKSK